MSWMMSCCSAALEILWLNHILEAKQLLSPPCAKKGLEKKMLTAKKPASEANSLSDL